MVSTTSARSDSTRPWFTIGLTRQPTSISPSLRIYADALRIRVYEDTYKFTRIAKRGRNFTVVATCITRVGTLLPILTHMGLGRRAHLGIRHMVNMVGFVIWLESHKENTQGLT